MRSALADPNDAKAGRPRLWVVGLSLSVLLVVGLVTWYVVRPDTYVAPDPDQAPGGPGGTAAGISPGDAADALTDLEEAVTSGDQEAAEQLAPQDDAAARTELVALAANARALQVADLTLRYVDETSALSPDGRWSAAVDVTWRFEDFDDAPARSEVAFTFSSDSSGEGVGIAAVGGADRRTPVWMSGPVTSRRTEQTLVLVAGAGGQTEAKLASYQQEAETAITDVRRVLTSWRPRLVVEVPETAQALDEALDAEPGRYDSIAAVTTTSDGSLAPGAPVHVFLNPAVFGDLRRTGAQVVMSHEAVHVATDAPASSMPRWLLEGFADYVALRDVDLPITTTAGQILERVRRNGAPEALPGPAEFDTAETHLGASYESAWQACEVLAAQGGEPALVELYEQVDDGADLDSELARLFGWSTAELVRAWQTRLTDLAG